MARFAYHEDAFDTEFGGIESFPTDDRLLPELEDDDELSGEALMHLLGDDLDPDLFGSGMVDADPSTARWH